MTDAVAPANQQKAVVKKAGPKTIRETMNSDYFKKQVAIALPKHMTADRFIRVATTAVLKIPKLMNCSETSMLSCLLTLSQLGLEPDGRLAHLIPFGSDCTLIIDYKGLVDLVMRTGKVAVIHADKICENDEFDYDRGEVKVHRVNFKEPRGDAYAYYCLIRFKDGTEKAEVMTLDEVNGIRKRSRAGSSGPWVTDFDEMAKKTVFRRCSKWLPMSSELSLALEKDGDILPPIGSMKPLKLGEAIDLTDGADEALSAIKPADVVQETKVEPEAAAETPDDEEESAEEEDDNEPTGEPVAEIDQEHERLLKAILNRSLSAPKQFAVVSKSVGIDPKDWRTAPKDGLAKLLKKLEAQEGK